MSSSPKLQFTQGYFYHVELFQQNISSNWKLENFAVKEIFLHSLVIRLPAPLGKINSQLVACWQSQQIILFQTLNALLAPPKMLKLSMQKQGFQSLNAVKCMQHMVIFSLKTWVKSVICFFLKRKKIREAHHCKSAAVISPQFLALQRFQDVCEEGYPSKF